VPDLPFVIVDRRRCHVDHCGGTMGRADDGVSVTSSPYTVVQSDAATCDAATDFMRSDSQEACR
jgi:hypothetical protein